MSKLSPCPFCGNKSMKWWDAQGEPEHSWMIVCRECGASSDYFTTKREAVVAWNRRTK